MSQEAGRYEEYDEIELLIDTDPIALGRLTRALEVRVQSLIQAGHEATVNIPARVEAMKAVIDHGLWNGSPLDALRFVDRELSALLGDLAVWKAVVNQ